VARDATTLFLDFLLVFGAAFFMKKRETVYYIHSTRKNFSKATMSEPAKIRIHVHLAHAGVASRRRAEQMVADGLVKVNNRKATIGQLVDPTKDEITFKGKPVSEPNQKHTYVLVNKPVGYVSTTHDDLGRPTVLDLLPEKLQRLRLYPVGRLDQDSRGLMLLTDDGDLAYRLTHPKFQVPKTYQVELDREPSEPAVEHLRRGVKLKEGKTASAEVNPVEGRGPNWLEITIHEGRNRQVRRMMERVGYQVYSLNRLSLGQYHLNDLHGQPWKEITLARHEDSVHDKGDTVA
jgi:pseudouridine synthase